MVAGRAESHMFCSCAELVLLFRGAKNLDAGV